MLDAPSVSPSYSQGDTAASNASSNTVAVPAAPNSNATLTTVNDAPSDAPNDSPATPLKAPAASKDALSTVPAAADPALKDTYAPGAFPSHRATEFKPAKLPNVSSTYRVDNALPTTPKAKAKAASRAGLPPRPAGRASPCSSGGQNTHTFNNVSQRVTLIERSYLRRIQHLESQRYEQKMMIDFLGDELERIVETINSAPKILYPMPIHGPPPAAYQPLLEPQSYPVSAPMDFDYPPPQQGPVEPHYYPLPQHRPMDTHYYPPPQHASYILPYLPPTAPVQNSLYPHVHYPSIAPWYNGYPYTYPALAPGFVWRYECEACGA